MLATQAERLIFRIRRDFNRGARLHLCGPFANQAYDPPDQVSANTKALQDFLVLIQDVIGDEPNEVVFLCPLVEDIGAGVSARNERLAEARDASQPPTRLCQPPHVARGAYLSAATVISGVRLSLR